MKRTMLLSALLLGTSAWAALPRESAAVITGQIQFGGERVYPSGSVPTLTFSASSGRGFPSQKVAAFLYYSLEPEAAKTSPWAPQFAGIITVPGAITVIVDNVPERGPINEHSREKFVQGVLFDIKTGEQLAVTNQDYLDIEYSGEPTDYTLDFETDDDFATPFRNGQDLSTPPEFGRLVSIASEQPPQPPRHFGPAIFDSDPDGPNALSSDPDLLVGTGNVVILQENFGQSVGGAFTLPDDSANGGTVRFDFTGFGYIEKVLPLSIDLVDVDPAGGGVQVLLTDVLGHVRTYAVPAGWTTDIDAGGPPGFGTLDLTDVAPQPGVSATATVASDPLYIPGEVVRIDVVWGGSGAIDNLAFRREPDPGFDSDRAPAVRRAPTRSATFR